MGGEQGPPLFPSRPTASFTFCASPLSPLGCLLHAKSLGPARALYVFMPRCPVRKRTAARRLPAPGPSRHAVNENTGSGHAYAARSRPPRRPPLRHHIADFGETAYHSPKNMTDAGPGPERIPRARFPIRRIMAQKGAQKRPEAASVRSLPQIAGRSGTGGVLSFHAQRRRGRMAELRLLPRHRPRLQRHRTDAGRGRVLRAPNH